MELIDKSALVAEIEELDEFWHLSKSPDGQAFIGSLLSFLDDAEVKEVDLEKELDFNAEVSKFINTFYKNAKIGHKLMIRRTAKYFFELGLKVKGE